MKKTASILLSIMLASCGGGDSSVQIFQYQGTVSGANCFGGFPQSAQISYAVTIDSLSTGSGVKLVDEAGNVWTGAMTSPSSFKVTEASANADPRMSIVLSNVAPTGAHVDATTTCVSFRCCTTLSGDVRS